MDFAISLLKFEPTKAKVNNIVTPKPKDIIVIGVILLVWVIFLTDTLIEIFGCFLSPLNNLMIKFDNK